MSSIFRVPAQPLLRPLERVGGRKPWRAKPRWWRVEEDWHYWLGEVRYVVPRQFEFDGASIPVCLWGCRSPVGRAFLAGLVHDWGYRHASLQRAPVGGAPYPEEKTRAELDAIFRRSVADHWWGRWVAYGGLRVWGGVAWRHHRRVLPAG